MRRTGPLLTGLERAVQAATIDAAEKRSLQVQCQPKTQV